MAVLLQIDFPFQGPWGAQMSEALQGLATSIAEELGLLWKIWTESPEREEAGGIYLFSDRAQAEAYLAMHTARLQSFGVPQVNGKLFEINTALSLIDRAPLPAAAADAP
ncbi:monooxygenase [Pseudomonas sp. NW5]|uniref:monooxygenase n=1 Tax=Pseudomonas sp. NW5 TaxID=2934934 RepID=UPI00201FFEDD|nr:monooxygenase [Pseudomonas sp. NW5]MCL7462667.1 monooxygenase [Pseudomonas sp. NW5]